MNALTRKLHSKPMHLPSGLTGASLKASPAHGSEPNAASAMSASRSITKALQAGHAPTPRPSWIAREAVREMRARSIAELKDRLSDVRAQAKRLRTYRNDDVNELVRLETERDNILYAIERAGAPGRPFGRREDA